ncbi:MAG: hypothetical protein WC683_16100 [bacterium]
MNHPTLPGIPKRARFKLRGPLEADIQAATLRCLGVELVRLVVDRKTNRKKLVHTGLFVSRDRKAYYWRANSGRKLYDYTTATGQTGKGMFRGAPKGTADILGVCCGVPMAFEIKRDDDEQQTAEQREWQAIHEAAGGLYWVIRSPSQAMAADQEVRRARAA